MSPYGMASAIPPAVRRPIGSQLSLRQLTVFRVTCVSAFTFGKAEAVIVRLEQKINQK